MNELLARVQDGTAVPEDYQALRQLIDGDTTGEIVAHVHAFHQKQEQPYDAAQWSGIVQQILAVDKQRKPVVKRLYIWTAAAAVALVALALFIFIEPSKKTVPVAVVPQQKPIEPGKNGAVLTLGNGQTIVLDSQSSGLIATEGETKVVLENGSLQYEGVSKTAAWNTLRTPRGGQYQLVLPDGSKVWMNAASTMRFPTAFTGNERVVELTGEAYLEVTPNKQMPFKVKARNTTIEVLGTHFNINAYDDEQEVTTTLLEGKVKVNNTMTLKPGQQAVVHDARTTLHDNVNVEQVTAWKNGLFHFDGAALQVVMRQLSRWYDVDVSYEGHPDTTMTFSGKMGRDLRLEQVLKILQKSEVHFNIKNRSIIVKP